MKIIVEIERFVLEGMHVGAREAAQIQTAVEGELTRMIAEGGLGREAHVSTTIPSVAGPDLMLKKESARRVGERIAQSVYAGVAGVRPGARPGRGERR